MVDTPQVKTQMTLEEFKALTESTQPTELIQGALIVSPAPKDPHQRTSMQALAYFVKLDIQAEIRHQPTDLYLNENVLQPDIFVVLTNNHTCTLQDDSYWHGPPDLVIEIVSPSTERRDRGAKFDIYEQYGVREYWLIEALAQYIEVYVHDGEKFARYGVFGPDSSFESPVLSGQQIDVSAVLGQPSDA